MSFRDALRSKEFVVTAELPLTSATTKESLINDARMLRDSVDGFLLTDNQYGQPHMAPSYAAGILQAEKFAPVLQISCRNRNRIALMGELLGAKATGIDTVYLVNGAVLPEGYSPRPVAVMDTQANDLIETAQLMNEQEDLVPGSENINWCISNRARSVAGEKSRETAGEGGCRCEAHDHTNMYEQ